MSGLPGHRTTEQVTHDGRNELTDSGAEQAKVTAWEDLAMGQDPIPGSQMVSSCILTLAEERKSFLGSLSEEHYPSILLT